MEVASQRAPSPAMLAGAVRILVTAGEILLREGDTGDDVFHVVEGTFEVLRGSATRVEVVGAGATVGEIAALARCPRTATVRALTPARVDRIDGERYRRLLTDDPGLLEDVTDLAMRRIDGHRIVELLIVSFGLDPAVAADVSTRCRRVHLEPGQVLFTEGDPSDAGYLVVSGRLAVERGGAAIGEVTRGEMVGEVGLIDLGPRSATVTARRESTLARLDRETFEALALEHPTLALHLSRSIVARHGRSRTGPGRARTIVVAVTAPVDARACVARIADQVARYGRTAHVGATRLGAALGRPDLLEECPALAFPAIGEYLHDVETGREYVLLEADPADTAWTRLATALADRLVVIASARPDEREAHAIARVLGAVPPHARPERWLAVVHPAGTEQPTGAALADRFGIERVAQLRAGSDADVDRLARLVSGNATGLVLGGGGAKGFAHLGVWRALHELGVEVDTIGGSSIGSPLGAGMARQLSPDDLDELAAELFRDLLDYTVPVVSLVKGERITKSIARAFGDIDVRDLWLPFFCVSTNLTRSRVEVHDRGDAARAIRASVAIPGILPPVPAGDDLLVDGGVLNNLPCDVMRGFGTVGRLIAVDLAPAAGPRAHDDFGLAVSGWAALRSQLGKGRTRYPGVMSILMRALVAGSVRDRDRLVEDGTVDWYLDLDLRGVQLLDFERVADTARRGYEAALPRIEAFLQRDLA